MNNNQRDEHLLTKEGKVELERELRFLTQEKLPAVIERVAAARENGDLKENADYHAARDEQSFIEGKISELAEVLTLAKVVDGPGKKSSLVDVGSKVHVQIKSKKMVLHIVGVREADPGQNKISHQSPIGQALIGKKRGDEVRVEAPAGMMTYKVLKIE